MKYLLLVPFLLGSAALMLTALIEVWWEIVHPRAGTFPGASLSLAVAATLLVLGAPLLFVFAFEI